jgi:hypothetical protein
MSSTTILELREKDSYKSYNAGDYSIQLAKPIKVSAGDNIILSKAFIDTKAETDDKIHIEEDIVLILINMVFVKNWTMEGRTKLDINQANNDGKDYFKCSRLPPNHPDFSNVKQITQIRFFQAPGTERKFTKWGQKGHEQVSFIYKNAFGITEHFLMTIPSTKTVGDGYVDVDCSFLISGTIVDNQSTSLTKNPNDTNWDFDNCSSFNIQDYNENFTEAILQPTTFSHSIPIPQGDYEAQEICKLMNDSMTKNRLTPFFSGTEILVSPYLKATNDFQGADENFYVSTDGEEVLTIASNYIVGSSQVQINYDPQISLFYWEILHEPMYAGGSISTQIIQDVGTGSTQNYYVNSRAGGICWTYLGARKASSGQDARDYDFWNAKLGFDIDELTLTPKPKEPFINRTNGNLAYNFLELEMLDGINTTNSFNSIDNMVNKTNYWKLPTIIDGTTTFTASSSSLFSSIYAKVRKLEQDVLVGGYFLIDIKGGFTTDMIGQTSTSKNICGVVSRYYSIGAYTTGGGDAGAVYTHRGTPEYLTEFTIRILDPDKKLAIVGNDNTIFLEIVNNQVRIEAEQLAQKKK